MTPGTLNAAWTGERNLKQPLLAPCPLEQHSACTQQFPLFSWPARRAVSISAGVINRAVTAAAPLKVTALWPRCWSHPSSPGRVHPLLTISSSSAPPGPPSPPEIAPLPPAVQTPLPFCHRRHEFWRAYYVAYYVTARLRRSSATPADPLDAVPQRSGR